MKGEASVRVAMHFAFDEVARQLDVGDTLFNITPEESILHYRYLANELYELRNFLTLHFGNFEGPTVPHAINLIRILNKMEPTPPKPNPEDPEIVRERVKHYLREYFSHPVVTDMIVCLDDLGARFGVPRNLSSQYLIECINDGSVKQIGNFIYGMGKEPILEAAVTLGRGTKTRLVENLAHVFHVGQETMAEELNDAIARGTTGFGIVQNKNEITVTPVSQKKAALTKALKKKKKRN
jgi:hypothetical protein